MTYSLATAPTAPGLFSMTTGWPHAALSFGAINRATISPPPPGAKGTMTCTGRAGKSCACAAASAPKSAIANAAVGQNRLPMAMPFSFCFGPLAARIPTNSRSLARRPWPRRQETKELGPVAPAPCAAYIPTTFPVILDDVECFAQKAGGAQRRFTYGDRAPDAESNRRMAGREYLVVVRPDRAALQPASAGSEGDRRRRRRAGHQRARSDPYRAIDPRRDYRRRSRPEPPVAHRRSEGAPARNEAEEGPPLPAGIAPPGSAERHPVAGAQPSRAQGQRHHAARRHHQVDHFGDPRPHPLEFGEPDAARSGDAWAVLADRSRHRSAEGGQGEAGADRSAGRDAIARFRHHGAEGRARARRAGSGEEVRRARCQRRVRQAQAAWWEGRVRSLRPRFAGAENNSPPIIAQHDAGAAGGDEFVAKFFQIGAIVHGDADVVAQSAA